MHRDQVQRGDGADGGGGPSGADSIGGEGVIDEGAAEASDPTAWARNTPDPDLAAVLPWMFAGRAGGQPGHPDGAAPGADVVDGWVVIASARSQLEAQIVAATLRDGGIDALCDEPKLVPLDDALRQRRMRVQVRVPARQERAAQAVLRRHVEEARALDWDSVDVGERADSIVGRRPGGVPVLAMAVAVLALIGLGVMALMAVMAMVR